MASMDKLKFALRSIAAVTGLTGRTALRRTVRDCAGITVLCLLLAYWSAQNAPVPAWLAFGCGIERVAQLKYDSGDIRAFWEDDLRFLRQF